MINYCALTKILTCYSNIF